VQDTVQQLHDLKTAAYEQAVQNGAVQLRPGVLQLMESAFRDGLQLAIATTTSPVNIAALLRATLGPRWSRYFMVIEDASTAPLKKPHPQVYLQTLKRLQLPASACLAFEDSANGLQAALGAGLQALITPNHFTAGHDFSGALRVLPDLLGTSVADLRAWHAVATGSNSSPDKQINLQET
jgi:HAD superfamily hydrolase (TIGR01509 family)